MSEAIIARGGRTITLLDPNRPKTLYTEIFNHNIIWTVPNGVVNNTVYVRLFGGGGGGTTGSGGGGGWMNNSEILVNSGEVVNIIIGDGGTSYNNYSTPGNSGGYNIFWRLFIC